MSILIHSATEGFWIGFGEMNHGCIIPDSNELIRIHSLPYITAHYYSI